MDSVIVFRQLTQENILEIVDIILSRVNERLVEYGLRVTATNPAKEWLAEEGFDPEFGARPLRRVVQQEVEDTLSDAVLAGRFEEGDTVIIDVKDDEIVLRKDEDADSPAEEDAEEAMPTV